MPRPWCSSCQRWLREDVHTCYNHRPKLRRLIVGEGTKTHLAVFEPTYNAANERVFMDESTLCNRVGYLGGHLVTDESDLNLAWLCKRCSAAWLRMSVYKD